MNRLSEATKDAFNAVIQLRKAPGDASAPAVHAGVRERIDEAIARARNTGISESDVADIAYALVAMADEFAQRESTGLSQYWHQQPLQLTYFAENVAGEGFFLRLDRILSDPSRVEALVTYHTCLQLGFEGRYAVRGGERELDLVRRRVQEAMVSLLRPEGLSRRHLPPVETGRGWNLDFMLLWASLFSLLFAACFWLVLRLALETMSVDLAQGCEGLLEAIASIRTPQEHS